MIGAADLRAFCRPPMGVPVAFAGVSTYADDGSAICGLLDRPGKVALRGSGTAGLESAAPELRLPCDAFTPMPTGGDVVTITDRGVTTSYELGVPEPEDDGAFLVYALYTVLDGEAEGDDEQ